MLMTCTFVAFEANTRAYDSGRGGRSCGKLIGSDPTPTSAVNAWLRAVHRRLSCRATCELALDEHRLEHARNGATSLEEWLIEGEIVASGVAVGAVRLDARHVKLPEPRAERVDQRVPKGE